MNVAFSSGWQSVSGRLLPDMTGRNRPKADFSAASYQASVESRKRLRNSERFSIRHDRSMLTVPADRIVPKSSGNVCRLTSHVSQFLPNCIQTNLELIGKMPSHIHVHLWN